MNIAKMVAFLAISLGAMSAQAVETFMVFDNTGSCEIASRANMVSAYKPVTKAPFQGGKGWTKKVVPAGGACLGKAHVMEDGAPVNGKTVWVPEGFVYWEHTRGAFRMDECSNPFGEIVFTGTKKAEAPPTPVVGCGDDCNRTVTDNVTYVTNVTRVCRVDGIFVPIVDGKCEPGSIRVLLSTNVETKVTGGCQGSCAPQAPQPSPQKKADADCLDCHPEVKLTGRVPRNDRRCVLSLEGFGTTYYVRFETKKGTMLLEAARVNDAKGEWVLTNPLSHVGDGKMTVTLDQPKSCKASVEAFISRRSFEWTAKRIGIPADCKPVRIERSVDGPRTGPAEQKQVDFDLDDA